MRRIFQSASIFAAMLLAGCSGSSQPAQGTRAPDLYKVNLDTSKGAVVIEVHRDWAPLGADRFYELVKSGFYDGARFFRVLPGFMAQFGIAGDPKVNAKWKDANIQDDPVKQSNTQGMVTFAKTSLPNSRSTQLFINTADNARLDSDGFAPFGKVISGLDVVQNFYSGYGEGAPQGRGPDQSQLNEQGNAYLGKDFPQLDYIQKATVQ
jgi:peptidyl-prolyl cis-trans isomerase A (cyclophilin A)